LAANSKRKIVPIHIAKTRITPSFEYFLTNVYQLYHENQTSAKKTIEAIKIKASFP